MCLVSFWRCKGTAKFNNGNGFGHKKHQKQHYSWRKSRNCVRTQCYFWCFMMGFTLQSMCLPWPSRWLHSRHHGSTGRGRCRRSRYCRQECRSLPRLYSLTGKAHRRASSRRYACTARPWRSHPPTHWGQAETACRKPGTTLRSVLTCRVVATVSLTDHVLNIFHSLLPDFIACCASEYTLLK